MEKEPKEPPVFYLCFVLIIVGVVGVLGAFGLTFEVIRDRMLGDATPQTISAADLLSKGAGSNRHISVTGFTIGTGGVERSSISRLETYLVVSPTGTPPGTPGKSLIVHLTEYHNEGPVGDVESATYTGIYNPEENLSPEHTRLLSENYPGLDYDQIPYREVRPYKGQHFARVLWFGGVGAPILVAGILGMVAVNRRMHPPPSPTKKTKKRRRDN